MIIHETGIAKVSVVETTPFMDERGCFARLYCRNELNALSKNLSIMQINHSVTRKVGAIRGMHFQFPPYSEIKMVRCLKGRVFDVALDLRANSDTFGQWHGEELTPENARMLVIPEGCAHGFQCLAEDSELLYLHTEFYNPEHEGGVLYNDPAFNIQWPIACSEISSKDAGYSKITLHSQGIAL